MFGEKIDLDRYINYEVKYETQLKKVKRSPNGLQALCPFHEDTNASFSVDSKTGRYNCFACGAKGNYIDFVANIKHIETDEAYKMILKDIGKYEEPKQKYTIEEYSDAKKLPVIFLKENFEISTFREGIKIPYKDETGMQTATRYRYANKKFLWSKGSKVGLYGLHLLNSIRSKGYVVLVEGESDTHTLWLHGIPALGVPGATTFQETWVKYFEGIDIYIHHEGDTGADTFIKKTSEALFHKGFENDVYKITCRCVDVKDPSDLHIKSKTEFEEKFNMVMSQKEKLDIKALAINVEETIPGAPITLRQPILWRIDKSGIYYLGSKDGLDILVCKTPILLFNRMHSLDTGEEKIEIAYLRDNKWRYAIYPRSTIFQSRTIVQLADIGITVTSENSKMLVKFLGALEAENMDVLNLKKSVSQLGWYGNKFLPCKKDDLIIDVDRASQKWINAYTEQGTIEKWKADMKPYFENNIFRFMVASSFAAPLLKHLNHRIFFVHNWADSRSGKTACLKAALSIWGEAEELMTNFNATKVGLERIAGFFNDLPLGIDEKQVAGNNQNYIDTLVYMIGNGGSKLRGSKAGGVQAMKSWKTIVLTTGEEPLSTMTTQTGVSTRALEIYGSPFKGEAEARKMHDIALENYGVAGPIFIDKLLNEYEKEFSKLKEMHKDIQETLSSEAENKVLSHISSVAVVVLADILMNRYIYDIDTTESSIAMGRNILTLLHTVKEIDIVEKAYEYMQSWILSNDGFFVRDDAYQNSADFLSVYGLKDGDTYYVFPNIFNTALEKAKFNPMKVLKGFVEKGYLETEGTGFQRQKRFRCKRTRFIAFKINAEVDLEAEDLPF